MKEVENGVEAKETPVATKVLKVVFVLGMWFAHCLVCRSGGLRGPESPGYKIMCIGCVDMSCLIRRCLVLSFLRMFLKRFCVDLLPGVCVRSREDVE